MKKSMKIPNWTIERKTSPASNAVSLAEAKAHLRVGGTAQDAMIQRLVIAATEQLEIDTERTWVAQTFQQRLLSFPEESGSILINMRPVYSVESVKYKSEDNGTISEQTLATDQYNLDIARRRIFLADGVSSWPNTIEADSAVTIDFTAGQPSADCVPELAKQAILLEVGRLYFDPAQENLVNTNDGRSYENIVRKLTRTSYP